MCLCLSLDGTTGVVGPIPACYREVFRLERFSFLDVVKYRSWHGILWRDVVFSLQCVHDELVHELRFQNQIHSQVLHKHEVDQKLYIALDDK